MKNNEINDDDHIVVLVNVDQVYTIQKHTHTTHINNEVIIN